ncbi:MAG TPA: hypothetical protein VJ276_05515 [Thermoanaerobaculia bacterium]|nr:hypothetical protein [Thermoanaerobaculia bacterium]
MSNFLDDLFSARIPKLSYAWTVADVDVPSGLPHISFGTGILTLSEAPRSKEYFYLRPPLRYVDSDVKMWSTSGIHVSPDSFETPRAPGWVDQLVILPSGVVIYGRRTNFGVENGSFAPEIYIGSGFPGYPALRTGILTSRIWLGVYTIVLALPDSFAFSRDDRTSSSSA